MSSTSAPPEAEKNSSPLMNPIAQTVAPSKIPIRAASKFPTRPTSKFSIRATSKIPIRGTPKIPTRVISKTPLRAISSPASSSSAHHLRGATKSAKYDKVASSQATIVKITTCQADDAQPEPNLATENTVRVITDASLCERCSRIDFGKIADTKVEDLQSEQHRLFCISDASLPSRTFQIIQSGCPMWEYSCPLCRLFAAYVRRAGIENQGYSFTIRSSVLTSFGEISYEYKVVNALSKDVPCIAVPEPPSNSSHSSREKIFCIRKTKHKSRITTPMIVQQVCNLDACKEWLGFCHRNHRICKLAKKGSPRPNRLRVIDCQCLEIINAPTNALYFALSYVWGSRYDSGKNVFSRTVRDAMAVTKALGYRYLWVDKHCIDQEKEHEKRDQINQMNLVYRTAVLTIIAAAGSDANAGLPGVLDTPRDHQPAVEVGDFDIVSSMPHPHYTIAKSYWSSRAWTFQEAVLSRRRLVFTPDQTYFECDEMMRWESLIKDKSLFVDPEYEVLPSRMGIFGPQVYREYHLSTSKEHKRISWLNNFVEQYTARNLSYEQDSLNAMVGIFKRYNYHSYDKSGNLKELCSHLWGLPFFCDRDEFWYCPDLYWHHNTRGDGGVPTRRKDFPSWSWAGWSGPVVLPTPGPPIDKKHIILESEGSSRLRLDRVLETNCTDFLQFRTLLLEGSFLDMTEFKVRPRVVGDDCEYDLRIGDTSGTLYFSKPHDDVATVVAQFQSREYELVTPGESNRYASAFSLIVEKHSNFYFRIGSAEMYGMPVFRESCVVRLR